MFPSNSRSVTEYENNRLHSSKAMTHAITDVMTHSVMMPRCSDRREAPNTMRVLMPRTRIGLSTSAKFRKCVAAMIMSNRLASTRMMNMGLKPCLPELMDLAVSK